ncbi:hypothetical protein RDWZM_002837 [Blomia tropicalis]|uniref:Uncharacterized protein n=1 Tax=Blomia tropicalis TaxID=40697 RepID=A0A9Q0MH28_BLOTA|nr:hypothetical protein RDWZM_002837 [Blomia tropicalis]
MKSFVALFALIAVAQTNSFFSEEELNNEFFKFKNEYGRFYSNAQEEQYRREIFASNLEFITRHNREALAGRQTFTVGINNFTDITNEEFRRTMNGYRKLSAHSLAGSVHTDEDVLGLPDTVDWTTKGVVTPIKFQDVCASGWAFAAIASIEGQHALKTGKLVSLSEQNLIDCSRPEGNQGCGGGSINNAFQYVIDNKGIDTESSYRYFGIDQYCEFKKSSVGATIKSFTDVKTNSELALQTAVANVGPISVVIDASKNSFQFYQSGIYYDPSCSSTILDHGTTVVGYGTLNGVAYWKVKNSFGAWWGEKGYILMSRNMNNQCGIASKASYPNL